jgi:hypothetical protein
VLGCGAIEQAGALAGLGIPLGEVGERKNVYR